MQFKRSKDEHHRRTPSKRIYLLVLLALAVSTGTARIAQNAYTYRGMQVLDLPLLGQLPVVGVARDDLTIVNSSGVDWKDSVLYVNVGHQISSNIDGHGLMEIPKVYTGYLYRLGPLKASRQMTVSLRSFRSAVGAPFPGNLVSLDTFGAVWIARDGNNPMFFAPFRKYGSAAFDYLAAPPHSN